LGNGLLQMVSLCPTKDIRKFFVRALVETGRWSPFLGFLVVVQIHADVKEVDLMILLGKNLENGRCFIEMEHHASQLSGYVGALVGK